jgi:hypothetical protein
MFKNIIFLLGVLAINFMLVIVVANLLIYIPLCPTEHIVHIDSELHCSCYLWQVLMSGSMVLFSIGAILWWEYSLKVNYLVATYINMHIFIMFVVGSSLAAIDGFIGAIGPDTILASSSFEIIIVIIVASVIYGYLLQKFIKRSNIKRDWFLVMGLVLTYLYIPY